MFFIATDGFCIFLQPERFVNLGIEPPKGVLLFGPPGTGKTLCARAVANRTDACFIRVIGSELVQKYVGEVCDNLCKFFRISPFRHFFLFLFCAFVIFTQSKALCFVGSKNGA